MKASQKYVLFALFAATTMAGYTSAWAHATLKSATPAKKKVRRGRGKSATAATETTAEVAAESNEAQA